MSAAHAAALLIQSRESNNVHTSDAHDNEDYLLMSNIGDAELIYQFAGTMITTDSESDPQHQRRQTSNTTSEGSQL